MDTAVDALAGLDWKSGEPCQGRGHHEAHVPLGDARWVQRGTCPVCLVVRELRVCEGGRLYRLAVCDGVRCSVCRETSATEAWGFTFTPIGGAS